MKSLISKFIAVIALAASAAVVSLPIVGIVSTPAQAGYADVQDQLKAIATKDTRVTGVNSPASANKTEREANSASDSGN